VELILRSNGQRSKLPGTNMQKNVLRAHLRENCRRLTLNWSSPHSTGIVSGPHIVTLLRGVTLCPLLWK